MQRAAEEAMKIEPGPRRTKALHWIRNAQEENFDAEKPIDQSKADAAYFEKKVDQLIRRKQWQPAVKAGENAVRLYLKNEKSVPRQLYLDLAQALANAGRFDEARKLAERAPEHDRVWIFWLIGKIQVETDPEGAARLAEQNLGSDTRTILGFGFDMAILSARPGLLEKTADRGLEHIKQQKNAYERTEAARRDFVMQLENAVQGRHAKGKRLSAEMQAVVTKALDRVVQAYPEVGPTAADLYANLGEIDKALKIARVGIGGEWTSADALVQALVKKGRYEEAMKFAPRWLGIVAKGYAEDGRHQKALEVAVSIPLETDHTDIKGYVRNEALFAVALVQAKAGKVEQALATLDHIVPTLHWIVELKRRERSAAEHQIQYATNVAHRMLTSWGVKDPSGVRQLLAYSKEKLKNVPEAGRDHAVLLISSASRAAAKLFSEQTTSVEELLELAEAARGGERIRLLTKIAALHWEHKDRDAYRQAVRKAKETARSAPLEPHDRISAWVAIAVAAHLASSEQTDQKSLQSALNHAWEAAEQAIAAGKEDSVMVRMFVYSPFVWAYHKMNRWKELPHAFMKIESPFDRALAFYAVGALLEKEGERLFEKLNQAMSP